MKTKFTDVVKRFLWNCLYPNLAWDDCHIGIRTIIYYGIMQRVIGFNRGVSWPVHFTSVVVGSHNITRKKGATYPGFMPGCYIQAVNKIVIGTKTRTGPGVKFISANHDIVSINSLLPSSPIIIGDGCWIGANAVILPSVSLGDHTIVGAGAVVTKSFADGYYVIGGVPAKIIKHLDRNQFSNETT